METCILSGRSAKALTRPMLLAGIAIFFAKHSRKNVRSQHCIHLNYVAIAEHENGNLTEGCQRLQPEKVT